MRGHVEQTRHRYGLRLLAFSALLLVSFVVAVVSQERDVFISSEVHVAERLSSGMLLVPASCPSDPHFGADCEPTSEDVQNCTVLRVFTSGGTFTVPTYTGVLVVSVWGGGGGGGGDGSSDSDGGNGGQSRFSTLTTGGGLGGQDDDNANGGTGGAGGSAIGGDINIAGFSGGSAQIGATTSGRGARAPFGGHGGASVSPPDAAGFPGWTPGGSGSGGARDSTAPMGGGGGSGGYVERTYSVGELTSGSNISVTVGSGGSSGEGGRTSTGGAGARGEVHIFSCVASPPVVDLVATPGTIIRGQSSQLSWTSEHATSCLASGGWSGSKPIVGSQQVSPVATTTYSLRCTGDGGSVIDSVTVGVQPPACSDNVDNDGDLSIDGGDPGCASPNDTSELGSTACDDSVDNDGDGLVDYPDDLGCYEPDDTDETTCSPEFFCSVDDLYYRNAACVESPVTVPCPYGCSGHACLSPPAPIGGIAAKPRLVREGESTRVLWNANNATTCDVTGTNGDRWEDEVSSPSEGYLSGPIWTQSTYTLTCTGPGGSFTDVSPVVNIIPIFREI
ncbi:hypothetical protein A3A39_03480 [Candidatus Kaiserbacteria bacterium RIFCSPLOWO2_01_FULL_54_13]|uniref:Glycine-rich domain-containing protein n=1 Tax=Candidatus Kaiserbacteria bacterium RIFCSPLOWO2_01_FULL_54_13 TaxID=1798512 RepID=A0A1F6F392_9BACT|nr:MAG: hypothetical protein A3A39_03480 [Candidatus Kaiserbacteria bacterium RIFCSPLOWO2_01_FULL_54_13]